MLFCRSICKTETVENVGLLNYDNNYDVYRNLLDLERPKYGTAYIFPISLIQKSKWNTREKFFTQYYPLICERIVKSITTFNNISVVEALKILIPIFGFNLRFLLTEVLIDTAYQYPQYIDLYKEFPIGPGSKPTMKTLNDNQPAEDTNIQLVNSVFNDIQYMTYNGKNIYFSAENWEGIGCEFRKYSNLSKGTGRKRLYLNTAIVLS